VLLALLLLPLLALQAERGRDFFEEEEAGHGKLSGPAQPSLNAPAYQPVRVPPLAAPGFAPQTRLGYTVGDQWEPAIAADRFGHTYILYPQYGTVPNCGNCYSPTMILQISNDHGATWAAPTMIYPAGSTTGEWDAQIVVDPVDGRTLYSSWLQNGKSDIAFGKSTDFGATWAVSIVDSTNAGTDKPIIAARGQDIYIVYNHSQTVYSAASHDGGATWTEVKINANGKLGWSLAGGGTITPNGNVFFSWAGYEGNGGAKGKVNLYVSKSTDGSATWTTKLIDVSSSPPDCSAYQCGWAFLGAQMVLTSDAAGTLYGLWNAGTVDKGPERIYFAKSADGGNTWSAKADVSSAPAGTAHAFPAIVAGAAGDVRLGWMDARAAGALWNVYYRSSANGGASWSAETNLSTYVAGYTYIQSGGYSYPFGDYFEMDIDEQGTTHAVWGEGLNYQTPGSIWYARGK
jgi:hypothetical protein